MRKNTKAMTLFETMITICVSTLLFVSLASSFYMFRVLNKNTLKNSKKELNMIAIREYIETNTDRILLYKIGGTCMYVDVDELAPTYELFDYDKVYYLVDTLHANKFKQNHYLGEDAHIGTFDDIGLFDSNNNPIININGDYIVRFDIKEYTSENSRFYMVTYDEDENEKVVPIFQFTDRERGYSDPIGESLYYSEKANIARAPEEALNKLLDGIFTYEEKTSTVFDYTGKEEIVKTRLLVETLNNQSITVFDNLPYENLSVGFNIETNTYSVLDETGRLVPTYGVETSVACLDQDENGNPVFVESNDFGVAFVSDSNFDHGEVYCQANQIVFTGSQILDESNPLNLDEDSIPDDINEDTKYTYAFLGWVVEGDTGTDGLTTNNIKVSIPTANTKKKVMAVFSKDISVFTGNQDSGVIDYTLRYTYAKKHTYVVKCNIEYSEMNDSGAFDDRKISFVTGVYYKYDPQVYTGAKEN